MTPNPPAVLSGVELGDELVRTFFGTDLSMSPEEYVARNAHLILNFGYIRYEYADDALRNWVHRVADLLSSQFEVKRCRERYLTPEEITNAERIEAEEP